MKKSEYFSDLYYDCREELKSREETIKDLEQTIKNLQIQINTQNGQTTNGPSSETN